MVTSLKLPEEVKEELNNYRYDKEAYHVVIKRLMEENKKLKEDVEYLKEDKKQLYKLALATSDSVALVNNIHKATYFITKVVYDRTLTAEEQLKDLKTYLKEMLESYPYDVKATIRNFKEMLELEEAEVPEVLIEFENYIEEKY